MEQLIKPLKGAIQRDFKRCQKKGCKCATGALHGPYFSRIWYEEGKRRKVYVKAKDVPVVTAGISLYQSEERAAVLRKELGKRLNRATRAIYRAQLVEAEADSIRNGRFNFATGDES